MKLRPLCPSRGRVEVRSQEHSTMEYSSQKHRRLFTTLVLITDTRQGMSHTQHIGKEEGNSSTGSSLFLRSTLEGKKNGDHHHREAKTCGTPEHRLATTDFVGVKGRVEGAEDEHALDAAADDEGEIASQTDVEFEGGGDVVDTMVLVRVTRVNCKTSTNTYTRLIPPIWFMNCMPYANNTRRPVCTRSRLRMLRHLYSPCSFASLMVSRISSSSARIFGSSGGASYTLHKIARASFPCPFWYRYLGLSGRPKTRNMTMKAKSIWHAIGRRQAIPSGWRT